MIWAQRVFLRYFRVFLLIFSAAGVYSLDLGAADANTRYYGTVALQFQSTVLRKESESPTLRSPKVSQGARINNQPTLEIPLFKYEMNGIWQVFEHIKHWELNNCFSSIIYSTGITLILIPVRRC